MNQCPVKLGSKLQDCVKVLKTIRSAAKDIDWTTTVSSGLSVGLTLVCDWSSAHKQAEYFFYNLAEDALVLLTSSLSSLSAPAQ